MAQICLYLLTEARHLPSRLTQTSPPQKRAHGGPGAYSMIDLDLSRYDAIASRFAKKTLDDQSILKSGIETRQFNRLIERIEKVGIASRAPTLLTGSTGVGKGLAAASSWGAPRRQR